MDLLVVAVFALLLALAWVVALYIRTQRDLRVLQQLQSDTAQLKLDADALRAAIAGVWDQGDLSEPLTEEAEAQQ